MYGRRRVFDALDNLQKARVDLNRFVADVRADLIEGVPNGLTKHQMDYLWAANLLTVAAFAAMKVMQDPLNGSQAKWAREAALRAVPILVEEGDLRGDAHDGPAL